MPRAVSCTLEMLSRSEEMPRCLAKDTHVSILHESTPVGPYSRISSMETLSTKGTRSKVPRSPRSTPPASSMNFRWTSLRVNWNMRWSLGAPIVVASALMPNWSLIDSKTLPAKAVRGSLMTSVGVASGFSE